MRHWVVALVTLALAGAAGWAVVVASDPRRMPVAAVEVQGELSYLTHEVLVRTVAEPASVGFFRVDLPLVRRRLMEVPWVRDAQVRRVWPDRLRVTVTERVPAARWVGGGLVDSDGTLFRPAESEYPAGLVELEGPEGTQGLVLRRYRDVKEWLVLGGWKVRRLTADGRRSWRVHTDGGVTLVLGRDPAEAAVRRVSRVLPALQVQSGGTLAVADLRYPNGFAVRWRPPPEAEAPPPAVQEPKPQARTESRPQAKSGAESGARSATGPAVKPQARPGARTGARSEDRQGNGKKNR
ncbi:MAG: cell division protein FtsQ/DivIB [Gammaproteobacteria bacterium]|nr:cell division protein FtsQ/DivIB [Gammaproteobacteria bacterium]